MSASRKMAWIDDNPDRAQTANDLGAEFIDVKNKDLAARVEELLQGPQRRLVILDHILDKTCSTHPVFQRGSTLAEAIKEQWPLCPVIGITNTDVEKIDLRTKQAYDALFSFSDFGEQFDRIAPIATDFKRIGDATLRRPDQVVGLLRPPKHDIERLVAALPDDLKRPPFDASVASRVYRWVRRLMDRPGFLYDELWAATYLGLNPKGFAKVGSVLGQAVYAGVFAKSHDRRWWVSGLAESLYKHSEPELGEMSWDVGRRLPGIRRDHYSKCFACEDETPPEVVAFLDAASNDQQPMHLACTELHPRYKRELYFDDIRMMRGN